MSITKTIVRRVLVTSTLKAEFWYSSQKTAQPRDEARTSTIRSILPSQVVKPCFPETDAHETGNKRSKTKGPDSTEVRGEMRL
jgi:hypothetical protein